MAKKKPGPKPKKLVRLSVLNLKGSPEYHEWLTDLSKTTLVPTATIVRNAVSKWAGERGFRPPPEV